MNSKIMTHVVAGYPSCAECIELMLGMQQAGVYAIEVQIPFSDPTADGPTIMMANDIVLDNGMTTLASFELIRKARRQGLTLPVYVMSYVNKLFKFGFKDFCHEAKNCQADGLIVPDLPFDAAEYKELSRCSKRLGVELVPVLSPGVLPERLANYKIGTSKLVYLTSTKGITGKELTVKKELVDLVRLTRSMSECQVALGFGIRNKQHVDKVLELADIAVIGSEVIRVVEQNNISDAIKFIRTLTMS